MPTDIDLLQTTDQIFTDAARPRVYVAGTLSDPWEEAPYVYVESLRIVAAPAIDEARLVYEYGPQLRETTADGSPGPSVPVQYDPVEIVGKFCKVVIPERGADGGDVTWYGVIENDFRRPAGSTLDDFAISDAEGNPLGTQNLTAFGLARLMELARIQSAQIFCDETDHPPSASGAWKLGHGLTFNGERKAAEYDDRGNRSATKVGSPNPVYVFSGKPQGGELWDAYTAVEYLLTHHQPVDESENPLCEWRFADDVDPGNLDWYDVTVRTEGRSLKDVVDELITRKRGLSWYLTFDEESVTALLHVFSFASEPIDLGDEGMILANPNQRRLDFENAFDVEVQVCNSIAQKFDRVVVQGALRTSTATFSFDPATYHIEPDWNPADESDYKAGASGEAGYGALNRLDKCRWNRLARAEDRLKHVYRRFRIYAYFEQFIVGTGGTKWAVAPLVTDDDVVNGGVWGDGYVAGEDTATLWNRGIKIQPRLPLKDRFKYDGSRIADGDFGDTSAASDEDGQPTWEYLKPLFFSPAGTVKGVERYKAIDKLNEQSADEENLTDWSVSVKILEQRPAFDLNVSGRPQQFIAPTRFAGAAETDARENPARSVNPKGKGLDYKDFQATLTIELPHRVQVSRSTGIDTSGPGAQERVLYITVPDARLDYVLPSTVVAVRYGDLIYSDSGGFVRDDRPRLIAIATAAATWYGQTRQTIELAMKQIREVVALGWLITDVGPTYQLAQINTPITGITYDFGTQTTRFETAHAAMEFSIAGE